MSELTTPISRLTMDKKSKFQINILEKIVLDNLNLKISSINLRYLVQIIFMRGKELKLGNQNSARGNIPFDLYLHQRFMREEIPPLFNLPFNKSWQQGHVCPKAIDEQILFVTLNKRNHGKEHRYHDYFIGSQTFHWQSQNRSSPSNSFGQKIINHESNGSKVHLFVRKHKMAGKKPLPSFTLVNLPTKNTKEQNR